MATGQGTARNTAMERGPTVTWSPARRSAASAVAAVASITDARFADGGEGKLFVELDGEVRGNILGR